jgi:predicted nucleic acid-binding protein
VEFFRGGECTLLEAGLAAGVVEIPALVKIELLGNVLGAKERKALEQALADLPVIGLDLAHLERAARLKAQLAEWGTAVSARDAHVLQCAKDRQAILISADPLFLRIQKSAGVKVQMW